MRNQPDPVPIEPTMNERLKRMEDRQVDHSERMDLLEQTLKVNNSMTAEIRDVIEAAKVGFKVLGSLGVAAKWIGILAGAALSVYTFVYAITHHGATPK